MTKLQPKLICVDDDPTVLKSVSRLLEKYFQVLTFEDPHEALASVGGQVERIAILIADLRMPKLNGLELLKKVKVISPTTVRVILSGQLDTRDMMVAVNQAEIDRFILKPWDNEYFLLQMLEALQRHVLLSERKQLQHLAITDMVTGLRNHRFFQESLQTEVERSQRHSRPFCLIMVDIDYFKIFNDTHGHLEGDKALALVAEQLEKEVRSVDIVSRYGGEEFAIILPETELQPAIEVCERLRSAVENSSHETGRQLTISLGISQYIDKESPEELLERADKALYESKNSGRNRVTSL